MLMVVIAAHEHAILGFHGRTHGFGRNACLSWFGPATVALRTRRAGDQRKAERISRPAQGKVAAAVAALESQTARLKKMTLSRAAAPQHQVSAAVTVKQEPLDDY